MKKTKARTFCFVPGCWKPAITNRHPGYGRCAEHRFAVQPSKVKGQHPLPRFKVIS